MLEAHLRSGREAGAIRSSVDPAVVAPLLAAAMIGQFLLATEEGSRLSTSQVTDFLDMVRRSLATEPTVEPAERPAPPELPRKQRSKMDPAQQFLDLI